MTKPYITNAASRARPNHESAQPSLPRGTASRRRKRPRASAPSGSKGVAAPTPTHAIGTGGNRQRQRLLELQVGPAQRPAPLQTVAHVRSLRQPAPRNQVLHRVSRRQGLVSDTAFPAGHGRRCGPKCGDNSTHLQRASLLPASLWRNLWEHGPTGKPEPASGTNSGK